MNKNELIERRRRNSKEYYWSHVDEIKRKRDEEYAQAKASRKLRRPDEVFLQEWKRQLQARLQETTEQWLIDAITRQMTMIDEKMRKADQDG